MLDLGLAFEIDAYQFAFDSSADASCEFGQGMSFQKTGKDELREVYSLVAQDGFYTGGGMESVGARLADGELYSLREAGRLIGVGFVSVLKRTPGFADIAMIIGPGARGRGLGTLVVNALLQQCRLGNFIPTAVCGADNIISRKTLQRAGFHLDGCILRARL